MSDIGHLKCACQQCGAHIEFPETGIGEIIDCPHCGGKTRLSADGLDASAPLSDESASTPSGFGTSPKTPKMTSLLVTVVILFVTALVACAALFWSKSRNHAEPLVIIPTNQPGMNPQPPAELSQDVSETNGFQIGLITLEKADGGGIVYAVGTVKNDSERQRFGVKIALDEMDKKDNKIGNTSDYIAVLEPYREWRFRALLNAPNTAKAKLANIEEQK